jgi:hypothetical protein
MVEWSKATVCKTVQSWVRIPLYAQTLLSSRMLLDTLGDWTPESTEIDRQKRSGRVYRTIRNGTLNCLGSAIIGKTAVC